MNEVEKPTRRRRTWRTILLVAGALVALLAAGVILLPMLLPESAMCRQVEAALSERLGGRPVTVESAGFRWGEGLRVTGLKVGRRDGGPETLLARADRLLVRFSPLDVARAAAGGDVPIETLRVEGLEIWLVLERDGRWNTSDLAGPGAPGLHARSIQVTDGTIHVENRALGRSVTLAGVRGSIGELATTGQGYVTMAAQVPAPDGSDAGRLSITASTNSVDFSRSDALAGSLKVEWQDVVWSEALGMVLADPRLRGLMSRTTGRLSASFGGGAWQVEGAVEGNDLALESLGVEATVPHAILGFQVRRAAAEAPLKVDLVKFSAPGVNLHLEAGTLRVDGAALREVDLKARTMLTWAPLARSLAPLRRWAERFERLDGNADLVLAFKSTAEGLRLSGSLDLKDTRAVRPGVVRKQMDRVLVLEWEADGRSDLTGWNVRRVMVESEAGRLTAAGRLPLPDWGAEGGWQVGGATFEAEARVTDAGALVALAPVVRRVLGDIEMTGPLEAHVALAPEPTGAAAPACRAALHINLTPTAVRWPGGVAKPAGMEARLDGSALVAGDGRRVDLQKVSVHLDKAALDWIGTAEFRPARPVESPEATGEGEGPVAGRLSGQVSIEGVEAAGAVLLPGRFPPETPPIRGKAALAVEADLAGGAVEGTIEADLAGIAINAGQYFLKPDGRPAGARLTGKWTPGPPAVGTVPAGPSRLEGEAVLRLPGAVVRLTGQSQLRVAAAEPNPARPQQLAGAPPARSLVVEAGPVARLDVSADFDDLARAMELVPALNRRFAGRLAGGGHATLRLITVPKNLNLKAGADLTEASVDLEGVLAKPRQMPLEVRLSADVVSDQDAAGAPIFVCETEAEGRLGESATRATGRLEFLAPPALGALESVDEIEALLRSAAVQVAATWEHDAALREAVPFLAPLYDWCNLEGAIALAATISGTPARGTVHVDASATDCRILQSRRAGIVKPAGVPATVSLDVRYGQVPGEILLDTLVVRLADGKVEAAGRALFDPGAPGLWAFPMPTAWSLRVKGGVPDVRSVAALFPARVAALKATGGATLDMEASADAFGFSLERCEIAFRQTGLDWLGKRLLLDGPISYDGRRLATDGLRLAAGRSDVTLVAYVSDPGRAPRGSLFIRGKTVALEEVQALVEETSRRLASWAAPPGQAEAAVRTRMDDLSARLARRLRGLLGRADVSGDIALGEVTLAVADLGASYTLGGFEAECSLSRRRFDVPRFACTLNDGNVSGRLAIDFATLPPVLSLVFTAQDLKMGDNLKPFIDRTFPGMEVFGRFTHTEALTQELAKGSAPVGRGETVLVDGLLRGPGAPDYVTNLLPGLKLTTYRFNRMSNVFEHMPNGDTENRMIFDGQQYDIFMFGVTRAGGAINYTLGVDLSVSLGSKVWSRTLDQGKIPLMHYTGRIVGARYVPPGPEISYVLPHELAYDLFIRRNLLFQLLAHLGEKPPDLGNPPPPPGRSPTNPGP
ncbi:MAG: hypothetical protein NTX40_06605 [Planctomycetota bacterium]|nr:hypothetical protein [Planctomycetota bacterium]